VKRTIPHGQPGGLHVRPDQVFAAGKCLRATFTPFTSRLIGFRRTVTDQDDITLANKQMSFAECDVIAVKLRGTRHDKEGIAVLLYFGSLEA
jgi:hypothetical protein